VLVFTVMLTLCTAPHGVHVYAYVKVIHYCICCDRAMQQSCHTPVVCVTAAGCSTCIFNRFQYSCCIVRCLLPHRHTFATSTATVATTLCHNTLMHSSSSTSSSTGSSSSTYSSSTCCSSSSTSCSSTVLLCIKCTVKGSNECSTTL
jgi:hypothetical protein